MIPARRCFCDLDTCPPCWFRKPRNGKRGTGKPWKSLARKRSTEPYVKPPAPEIKRDPTWHEFLDAIYRREKLKLEKELDSPVPAE